MRFSIVAQTIEKENEDLSQKGATIYCKGNWTGMQSILDLNEDEVGFLNQILNNFASKGLRAVIYAKKELNAFSAAKFHKRLQNLKFSLMSQQENLIELAQEYENKLKLVGVLGLRDDLESNVENLIENLKDIDSKIWIVSGDSRENSLNCAKTINFVNTQNKDEFFDISDETQDGLLLTIRNILTELRNKFDDNEKSDKFKEKEKSKENIKEKDMKAIKKMERKKKNKIFTKFVSLSTEKLNLLKKKVLILNGKSLNLITKDSYLSSHFQFISHLCSRFIAYNLTPQQKASLVKMVKKKS